MSNDVILTIKNQLATIEGGLDEDTLAVAGSSGSNKRISIKGSVFRKIVGGKEVGSIEDRHMNIIFVKLAHTPSRTFYTEGYVEGKAVPPTCWSSDAKMPDASVKEPQAKSCDKCQWSVKGTGQNGQGTACRLAWRTAVVLPGDPGGDVMQLVLPAASVFGDEDSGRWPFRSYVQMLANHNISAGRVVTRMAFDTKAPSPRVLFSPVGAVPTEDLPIVKDQGASHAAENAVTMSVYHRDDAMVEDEVVEVAPPAEVAKVFAEVKAAEAVAEVHSEPETVVVEPKLREPVQGFVSPAKEKDVSSVIQKWASKKKEG